MKNLTLFRISILCILLSSLSILLTYFGDYNGTTLYRFVAYFVGFGFWFFLITGNIIFGVINSRRKKEEEKLKVKRKSKVKPGVISFFSNRYAFVFDIMLVLSFVLCLIFYFIPVWNGKIEIFFISVFVFSIHMHSFFNGVNYKYINKKRRVETDEKRKSRKAI